MPEALSKSDANKMAWRMRSMPEAMREKLARVGYRGFFATMAGAFDAVEPERYDAKTGEVIGGGGPDWRARLIAAGLYAKCTGLDASASVVMVNFFAKYGAKGEDELAQWVELGKRFEESRANAAIGPRELAPVAAEAYRKCLPALDPKDVESFARGLLAAIGCTDMAQEAPEVNGNGNGV
jgi:hypothetical protein